MRDFLHQPLDSVNDKLMVALNLYDSPIESVRVAFNMNGTEEWCKYPFGAGVIPNLCNEVTETVVENRKNKLLKAVMSLD